jgi:hypothetical protein
VSTRHHLFGIDVPKMPSKRTTAAPKSHNHCAALARLGTARSRDFGLSDLDLGNSRPVDRHRSDFNRSPRWTAADPLRGCRRSKREHPYE